MKKIGLFILLLTALNANELESFLLKEEPKANTQTKIIKIYIINAKKEAHKLEEDKVNKNDNFGYKDAFRNVQENEAMSNLKSEYYRNKQETETYKNSSVKIKATEEIILEHFQTPTKYNKYGLKEKVIISFDIDVNNTITNINFIEPSSYEDINELFIEAIMQSSQEIVTPKEKETKTVYFQFEI